MRCVIFCAGQQGELDFSLLPDDYIICCDRGYEYAEAQGVTPHLMIGDFDSLKRALPLDIPVLRYPVEKDDTDSLLAVRHALTKGCDDIVLLYSTGNRLDHTLANVALLAFIAERGARGRLVGAGEEVCLLREEQRTFFRREGSSLSVFAWGERAGGVTLTGVRYPLRDHTLTSAFPLGLGNSIIAAEAVVSVKEGSLLVVQSRL